MELAKSDMVKVTKFLIHVHDHLIDMQLILAIL